MANISNSQFEEYDQVLLSEKYQLYSELFFRDFVDKSVKDLPNDPNIALAIPFEYITFLKGTPTVG